MFVSLNSRETVPPGEALTERTHAKDISPALCVSLDHALVLTSLLLESLLLLIKQNPLALLRIPIWLFLGTAVLKAEIASRITLNPASLPYDYDLIAWLKLERDTGRQLWLFSESNELFAAQIAQHLKLFDRVVIGKQNTDPYVPTSRVSPARSGRLKALFRVLRPHQWAKNGLVMVPLLAAHDVGHPAAVLSSLIAAVVFCLCASSVYVLNDLLDLEADRTHPRKCKRPFAAGLLPLSMGFAMAPALLILAFALGSLLPASFTAVLSGYYLLTLAYSLSLKGKVLVDALVLACLYTLRLVAGAAAAVIPLSFWMLLFSVFLFLSLAFVKRYAELAALRRTNQLHAAGRGYEVRDLPILQSLGCASGYLSVLVLALYVNSPEIAALYGHPKMIWALCALLLFWISRVWMIAQRGGMHDDPVIFALKDRTSIGVGCLGAAIAVLAL